jgi:type IV protein arginine methyltransferase
MTYINKTLTFESDKIYYYNEAYGGNFEVMMSWEDSLMSASAAYICTGGGDILEIGFGMGISAGYIQSHSIKSHTIIENHPEIIPKAQTWASGKSNVTIVTGSWYDVKSGLSTYDGIFYDTFGDNGMIHFSSSLASLVKPGAKVTWWNNNPNETNYYNIPNVTYDQYPVSPPSNNYFNNNIYYLPKKEF